MSAANVAPDSAVTTSVSSGPCAKDAAPSSTTTADAVTTEVVADEAPELDVERCQHVAAPLEDGDVEAAVDEVLGHLQADEAATDDDGALGRPDGLEARVALHAGEEAGAPLDPLADGPGVGHGPHLEDARQVDARQRRPDRRRAR